MGKRKEEGKDGRGRGRAMGRGKRNGKEKGRRVRERENGRKIASGVFRIWQRGSWRARGAQAYNRGLGGAPSGVQGQSSWSGVRGAKASPP